MQLSTRVHIPTTLSAAISAVQDNPGARYVAGGTHLVATPTRAVTPVPGFVSLRRVPELTAITVTKDRISIGAAVTIARLREIPEIALVPVLDHSTRGLASRQIRERATVGGNLCSLEPDRTLPPCFLALNAEVGLASAGGERTMSLIEFYQQDPLSVLNAGTILTHVTWRRTSGFQGFSRVGRRNALCFAIASVALVIDEDSREIRVGLGNVGRSAQRALGAEALACTGLDWVTMTAPTEVTRSFESAVSEECNPETDVVATATYRRHAVGVMARRLLEQALENGSHR